MFSFNNSPNASAEQLAYSIQPEIQAPSVGSNKVVHISDSESDTEEPQCLLHLQRIPDNQVVHGTCTPTEISTSRASVEPHYLFSNPVEIEHSSVLESVDEIAPVTTEVPTGSVTSESQYLFSEPVVQSLVDGIAPASSEVVICSVAGESQYLFSNPVLQSVECIAPVTTEVASVTSGLHYLFSDPVEHSSVLESVDDMAPVNTEVPTSGVTDQSQYLFSEPVVQ